MQDLFHQQYGYSIKYFWIFPRKTLFRIAGIGVVAERQTNRIHSVLEKIFWIPDDPEKKNFHPFTCRTDFPNTASKRHHLLNCTMFNHTSQGIDNVVSQFTLQVVGGTTGRHLVANSTIKGLRPLTLLKTTTTTTTTTSSSSSSSSSS